MVMEGRGEDGVVVEPRASSASMRPRKASPSTPPVTHMESAHIQGRHLMVSSWAAPQGRHLKGRHLKGGTSRSARSPYRRTS